LFNCYIAKLLKINMTMQRIILHADLNSFFARAEQQTNPALRGKPVGVVKARGRTCIIAASIEAKKYGVATGCRVPDAKKLCGQIILVPADFDKYLDISRRFIKICADYSPNCEVFSLDECFIDVTETEKLFGNAFNIAFEIKDRLRKEVGDWLTCSIGVSYNRFLAKLASGQAKYDGLFWITEDNALQVLDKSNLMDVCGLGWGLYSHLAKLGIDNFPKLRACSIESLHQNFGPFWGPYLYNLCRGIDYTFVNSFRSLPKQKSVGRTYTTHKPLNNRKDVERLMRNLSEEAAFKARTMGLAGRYVGFSIRSAHGSQNSIVGSWLANRSFSEGWSGRKDNEARSWYGHRTLKNYIDLGKEVFDVCKIISRDWLFGKPQDKPIIFCRVTLGMLTKKDYLPLPLFPADQKYNDLTLAGDKINNRFGDYTIFPANLLGVDIIRPEVTGYFGDKKFQLRNFLLEN